MNNDSVRARYLQQILEILEVEVIDNRSKIKASEERLRELEDRQIRIQEERKKILNEMHNYEKSIYFFAEDGV